LYAKAITTRREIVAGEKKVVRFFSKKQQKTKIRPYARIPSGDQATLLFHYRKTSGSKPA
jgi:hypothetical protein